MMYVLKGPEKSANTKLRKGKGEMKRGKEKDWDAVERKNLFLGWKGTGGKRKREKRSRRGW